MRIRLSFGPQVRKVKPQRVLRHTKAQLAVRADGAEIDLLLESGGKPDIAIEVKRSSAPTLDKGFGLACDDLQVRQRYVVHPGNETYPVRHGAQAIGLLTLARLLQHG